ncbi:MAG: restriction endonuclease subunit S [Polyangiaceae bacterium]|nr:restriction endonuclease subunit S [Polyangiaceae bacterium]
MTDGFDVEKFVGTFPVVTETDGSAKKLRGLVLDLAISGRLPDKSHSPVALTIGSLTPIPTAWNVAPLGEITEIVRGITFPASAKHKAASRGLVACLRTTNVQQTVEWEDLLYVSETYVGRSDQWVRDGDLCISMANSYELVGKVALVTGQHPKVTFGGFLGVIRPNQSVLPAFLSVYMRSPTVQAELRKGATQTTNIANISLGRLRPLPVPVPPLPEQKRIVAKVDELMKLIDELEAKQTKKREVQTRFRTSALDALTKAAGPEELASAWNRVAGNFGVLFENQEDVVEVRASILQLAVTGRLTGHDAGDAGHEDASSKRVRPDAPGTTLPATWKWVKLGEVAELINGDRSKNYPNRAEYVEEGVPWINTGHIEPDGTLSLGSMHYISRKKFESLRSGKVRRGDLVYCLRGATLGKTAIITQFTEGAVASSLVIIRLAPVVDPAFAYRILTSPLGREQIFRFDNGSAQPNLSANNVKKYLVPLPPLAEQKRIVAKVEALMKLCDDLEARLKAKEATAGKLVEAVVKELVA